MKNKHIVGIALCAMVVIIAGCSNPMGRRNHCIDGRLGTAIGVLTLGASCLAEEIIEARLNNEASESEVDLDN